MPLVIFIVTFEKILQFFTGAMVPKVLYAPKVLRKLNNYKFIVRYTLLNQKYAHIVQEKHHNEYI